MIAAAAENKLANGTVDKSQAKVTREGSLAISAVYHEGRTDQLGALTFGSLLLKPPGTCRRIRRTSIEEEIMMTSPRAAARFRWEGKVDQRSCRR